MNNKLHKLFNAITHRTNDGKEISQTKNPATDSVAEQARAEANKRWTDDGHRMMSELASGLLEGLRQGFALGAEWQAEKQAKQSTPNA